MNGIRRRLSERRELQIPNYLKTRPSISNSIYSYTILYIFV